MNSFTKGLVHTVVTLVALYVPTLLIQSHVADLTVGTIVAWALNWLTSHTIPTTTGASTRI